MTLDDFFGLLSSRIPTGRELLDFVRGLGWRVRVSADGKPAIAHKSEDPEMLAAVVGVLKREPFRTAVIEAVRQEPPGDVPGESSPPSPASQPATTVAEREESCHRCRALVCFPAAADGLFCEQTQCPYKRLGTEAKASANHVWKW